MSFMSILLIAVGLSMDAFAVSITSGIVIKSLRISNVLKISIFFGVFQAVMPLAGWLAGYSFKDYIVQVDHWIAFGLLIIIGGKMIYEVVKGCDDGECELNPLDNKVLTLLAIATSIDALAVGVSFAFLNVNIFESVALIGITTFVICSIGVIVGKRCGEVLKNKAQVAGGLVLMFIGVKILAEHTNFHTYIMSMLQAMR